MTEDKDITKEWEKVSSLWSILLSDVALCQKQNREDQFWRRNYTRTVFACVEGTVFGLKSLVLASIGTVNLSFEEVMFLQERSYHITEQGQVRSENAKINTLANVRFTFFMLVKALELEDRSPDYSGNGWVQFRQMQRIRDRLTHPKNAAELDVSDSELHIIDAGYSWFNKSVTNILSGGIKRMKHILDELDYLFRWMEEAAAGATLEVSKETGEFLLKEESKIKRSEDKNPDIAE
jgi:hypothetical protein